MKKTTETISVIIPFYNEKDTIMVLVKDVTVQLKRVTSNWEIILVDDGSRDGSGSKIVTSEVIKKFIHRKRLGKGRALATGLAKAKGSIIVFMDADLQDDPKDLSKFLDKIGEGFDFVNGYRVDRKDPLHKTLPSSIFNFILKNIFHSKFHDINCGFKAMKRHVLSEIPFYGDNYRFLPIFAQSEGFAVTEVVITHKPRLYGVSKYGFWRMIFGFFDLLTHYFILKFIEKPIHFFGVVGGLVFLIGSTILSILGFERVFYGRLVYRRPMLFIGILLFIVGVQIVMTGFVGELIVYFHNKSKNNK